MNYKHLQYFWTVAQAGTIASAARKLELTPQTISVQISDLERDLGRDLFARKGGRLELTEDGRIALAFADDIFALGGEMQELLSVRHKRSRTRIRVGISATVPKMVIYSLLAPLLYQDKRPRLICQEGQAEHLMQHLASNRLDFVFLDRMLSFESGKARGISLGESDTALLVGSNLGTPQAGQSLAAILDSGSLLLPCRGNPMRDGLDVWLREHRQTVDIALESNDSALLKTFARNGAGIVLVPAVVSLDAQRCYRLVEVTRTDLFREQFRMIVRTGAHLEKEVALIQSAAREMFSIGQE